MADRKQCVSLPQGYRQTGSRTDMDATIVEALQTADQALSLIKNGQVIPSFFTNLLDA